MKKILLLIPIMALIFFYGCSIPTYLVIYNNTNEDIQLNWHYGETDKPVVLKTGSRIKILFPNLNFTLQMLSSKKSIEYTLIWPPKEFLGSDGIDKACFFQIEKNGKIYILKDNNFPAKTFPEQPEGYPLKPVKITYDGDNSDVVVQYFKDNKVDQLRLFIAKAKKGDTAKYFFNFLIATGYPSGGALPKFPEMPGISLWKAQSMVVRLAAVVPKIAVSEAVEGTVPQLGDGFRTVSMTKGELKWMKDIQTVINWYKKHDRKIKEPFRFYGEIVGVDGKNLVIEGNASVEILGGRLKAEKIVLTPHTSEIKYTATGNPFIRRGDGSEIKGTKIELLDCNPGIKLNLTGETKLQIRPKPED